VKYMEEAEPRGFGERAWASCLSGEVSTLTIPCPGFQEEKSPIHLNSGEEQSS
jgi:hypothetical protein